MALNERSVNNLKGVHPDLVRVVELAAERVPFIVTEGLRNLARQKQLKAAGKSWTLNSRHLTGHAVDVVDPDGRYDVPDMDHISVVMKAVAKELNIPIVWGGDWKTRDTPHFELDRKVYPASGVTTATKVKETVTKAVTSKTGVALGGGVATGVGTAVTETTPSLPSIPAPPDLTTVSAWQTFGETVSGLVTWVGAHPGIATVIVAWVGGTIFWTQIKSWFGWRPA
jgi:peptidoglycan L-alanyl-D-glutamate endopeptidase CwlK